MDAMRGMDPSSSMFHTQAARNISQIGFGSVRSQKEVAPKEEPQERNTEVRDNVQLSTSTAVADTEDMTENAAMSGELGELLDDYDEDASEVTERGQRRHKGDVDRMGHEGGNINGLRTDQEVSRLNQMDDPSLAVNDILKDIPQRSLEPAKNIVSNQVQNGRPAEALVALKPVEGVNAVDFAPAEKVGMLDIHDTNNKPISQDMEDGMDAAQRQDASSNYMDAMINNLSPERKAMVDEMRDAVNMWADATGGDADTAFAERLHDLAGGWDDEGLKTVSQTYVDAGRELASSAQ